MLIDTVLANSIDVPTFGNCSTLKPMPELLVVTINVPSDAAV